MTTSNNTLSPAQVLSCLVLGCLVLGLAACDSAPMSSGTVLGDDRDGVFVWRAAGTGEGPGEHEFMSFVGSLAGDSVVTYDDGLRRVQVFSPDGELARTMRAASPWSEFVTWDAVGVLGRLLAMLRIATFALDDGSVSELMDVPGAEQVISRGGRLSMAYTFGKGPEFAVAAGRLAVVDTEVFSIRSISLDDGSTTAILRRDEPIREVTSEHVEAYVDWMARRNMTGGLTAEDMEPRKAGWRERPKASTLPTRRRSAAIRGLHAGVRADVRSGEVARPLTARSGRRTSGRVPTPPSHPPTR